MHFITVGTENSTCVNLYYEDHGQGRPVVLIHGYPLSSAAWEKQVPALLAAGFRTIAYDRRGFGKSSQPASGYDYDTFAADLAMLMNELDLREAVLVGHSMGTGEIARYLANYGSSRVSKVVLLSPILPYLVKTPDNPEGLERSMFDGFMQKVKTDRFAYVTAFFTNFFNYEQTKGNQVSEDTFHAHWSQGVAASPIASLQCINAWLEDFRADVSRIDVPTLIIHGDADQVLPPPATAQRLPNMVPDCELVMLPGAPHAIPWTHATEINDKILQFIGAPALAAAH